MTGGAGWSTTYRPTAQAPRCHRLTAVQHSCQPVTARSSIMIDSELTGTAILRSADQRFTGAS